MADSKNFVTRAQILYTPQSFREADDSVEFTLSSEQPALVFDYARFEFITEVIVANGVILPDNMQVPLIDSHDRGTVKNVLGSVRDFKIEDGKVIGRLYFSKSKDAQEALLKVREGHLDSGSVGYRQEETVYIPEGESLIKDGKEYNGELYLTTKWALKEFSLVAMGADPGAKARNGSESVRVSEMAAREAAEKITEEKPMPKNDIKERAEMTETTANVAKDDIKEVTIRSARISELCAKHGCADKAAEYIRSNASVEQVQDAILDAIQARTVPLSTASRIEVGTEDVEKKRAAAVDGILIRSGIKLASPAPGAKDYSTLSFENIARNCLRASNVDTSYLGREEIIKRALSTSDFPNILANVASKSVIKGYEAGQQTYRIWAKTGMLPDFKTASRVALGDAPEMLLNESGEEVQQGVIGDRGESITLKTYARKLVITRQALINDDAGLFNRMFFAFGQRAANQIEAAAYGVLLDNEDLADGTPLFHTDHDNLEVTSKSIVNSTNLSIAMAAIGNQKSDGGMALSLMGRYILGGFENLVAASILCNSTTDATASSNADFNPYKNMGLVPVISGHIPGKKWFLVADNIDTVEVAFLNGKDTPTIEAIDNDGSVLGRTYLAYIDYAAKALDYRGMFCNPGA